MIRIGTSGWSYPSGRGTWNGVFYPARAGARGRRVDELAYYAEHFDTVEVNSTFYRVPAPAMTAVVGRAHARAASSSRSSSSRSSRTRRCIARRPGPRTPRSPSGRTACRRPRPPMPRPSRAAIEPLAAAGKLGPLLAQFPPSFKNTDADARLPGVAARAVARHPARRRAAAQDAGATSRATCASTARGARRGVGADRRAEVRVLDPAGPHARTRRPFFYMRLHGRNAAQWWDARARRGPLQLPLLGGGTRALRRGAPTSPAGS